jgi:hypothetical protein
LFAVFADYAFIGNYVMYPIPDGFFNLLFVPATVRSRAVSHRFMFTKDAHESPYLDYK